AGVLGQTPDERDSINHPTVLSGDIGVAGNASDNSYHIIAGTGTDVTAVLDGVSITGGDANGAGQGDCAAIYVTNGGLSLVNSVVSGNQATGLGGAIYASGGTLNILNSTFKQNTGSYGGAIYGNLIQSDITKTTFDSNAAGTDHDG